ncbi:MAG: CbtB domain-containing protein [Sedimenticolaceae bacterium]
MQNQTSQAEVLRATTISTTISKPLQLFAAFVLGGAIVYGAGFFDTAAVHNAAHDMRHSQGFPCH